MWADISTKQLPQKPQQVLCAWDKTKDVYELLIHWPDGLWTNLFEDRVDANEMPTHWQEIKPVPNTPNAPSSPAAQQSGEKNG